MKRLFFLICTLTIVLSGCTSKNETPQSNTQKFSNATVTPSNISVHIPTKEEVNSIVVINGAGATIYRPNNKNTTLTKILHWLKDAHPVSIKKPQYKGKSGPTSGIGGPARLQIITKNNETIMVSIASYSAPGSNGDSFHFINGILAYKILNKKVYLKSPKLYKWLKNNEWKKNFHS